MKDNSLASEIPYRCFVDNGIVDLRGMGIMAGYDFSGPSPEISDPPTLHDLSRQLAAAMVHLGTGDVLYAIYHRLPAPEPPTSGFTHRAAAIVDATRRAQFTNEDHWLTPTRVYLSHQYSTATRTMLQAILDASDMPNKQRQKELQRDFALQRFVAFEDAASAAVRLRRMSNEEMFRDLLMNITYVEYPAAMPEPNTRLNQVIGSTERQINGRQPMMGNWHLRTISIVMYPGMTVPQILAVLLTKPGRMTVSARFMALDGYDAQQSLEDEKRYWNRTGFESLQKIIAKLGIHTDKKDEHAEEMKYDIAQAITEGARGTAFGWGKITAILRDTDEARADFRAHEIIRECHAMGITARIEKLHTATAVMESWPGYVIPQGRKQAIRVRSPLVSAKNFADLVLPATPWVGTPYIDSELFPPNTPVPIACGGGGDGRPFYLPTHVNSSPHGLIIGPIRTGKSALIGAMICAFLGVPNSRINVLDVDESSFVACHLLEGNFRKIGDENSTPLCPLELLDQPDGLDWLEGWFERLFARWKLELNEQQAEQFSWSLREARRTGVRTISGLRALIPSDTGVGELQRIRRILRRYSTGSWKAIFDGEPTAASDNRVHVYEMRRLKAFGKAAAGPATEFILQSIISRLDGSPTWIFADEFWSMLGDEVSAEWLFDTIRSLPKKNCAFIGATQSLVEVVNSPQRDLLLENLAGKIFLPNYAARTEYGRDLYRKVGLDDNKITCIASMRPKAEYFYDSAYGSRKFNLQLNDVAQAICAATSYQDVTAARAILNESPDGFFLDAWLSHRLPGWQSELPVIATAKAIEGRGGTAIDDSDAGSRDMRIYGSDAA